MGYPIILYFILMMDLIRLQSLALSLTHKFDKKIVKIKESINLKKLLW